jgi:hypothetical protein
MRKRVLQILAMLLVVCPTIALAQAPKDGVYITDEDIKAVLKHAADTHRTIPDNTLRVIDMDKYQLGVAVVSRGAMGSAAPANANAAASGNAAPATARRAARSGLARRVPTESSTTIPPKAMWSYREAEL